ncbi:MAG: MaoC family dehydratase N-terminal domain-containing protein [Bacillota bacterium]|nr:MaoC family dehydratase N-terminal domain-containing protein [Bacillota bacterium]
MQQDEQAAEGLEPSLVGRASPPRPVRVEPEAVRRFARALGDPRADDPGWVPPTFPIRFGIWESGIPGLQLDLRRVLHGEQAFRYARPLRPGEELEVRSRVADVRRRKGSQGSLTLLDLEMLGVDAEGREVFAARTTLVVREGVGG